MNPLEVELLKSIAASPLELPKFLISPQTDMNRKWFSDGLADRVFSAIGKNAIENKRATLVGIIIDAKPSKEEFECIKSIWDNPASLSQEDINALVENFKNEALRHEAAGAIEEYQENVQLAPSAIRHSIDILGTTLSIISRDGVAYNPDPTTHYEDRGWELNGSWGNGVRGLNLITRGGMPRRGMWLYAAKSGTGKSTMCITAAAASIIKGEPSTIIANELPAGEYSRRLRQAVMYMYGGPEMKSQEDVDRQIKQYSTVWEWEYTFERVRQILYWQQPSFAAVDSITRIRPPVNLINNRMSDSSQHEIKADSFLHLAGEFNTLICAPGNGSKEEQERIVNKFDSIDSIMIFGSIAYYSACDLATVSIRHPSRQMVQRMKCVKNRYGSQTGDIVDMGFDVNAQCYYGGEYSSALN